MTSIKAEARHADEIGVQQRDGHGAIASALTSADVPVHHSIIVLSGCTINVAADCSECDLRGRVNQLIDIMNEYPSGMGVAVRLLHELDVPCCDLASRRAYALAALYVDSLLRDGCCGLSCDFDMLATILCSALRMKRRTAVGVIHALYDVGLLVAAPSHAEVVE